MSHNKALPRKIHLTRYELYRTLRLIKDTICIILIPVCPSGPSFIPAEHCAEGIPTEELQQEVSTSNRRSHVRIQLLSDTRATIRIVRINGNMVRSSPGPILLLNISPGGCGFRTALVFPVSTRIWLEIEWNSGHGSLRLAGHIVWRQPVDTAYRYGMQFRPMSQAEKRMLNHELNRLLLELCPGQSRIHLLYRAQNERLRY
ncbi:PilZ domain-containing protein [Cohnella sp. AR92]|uniref:PilZ domain-containing protein n=1 Tax=Cohnella sp. AR92 TaxID=648716 RepID=UPI000F8DFA05|nr:PilZ domain-containing protein [Cohnella sp. AR92]RUS45279.1 PilZ domain-containing protein [Cohnella sp. AR92]